MAAIHFPGDLVHVLVASNDRVLRASLHQVLQAGGHTVELASDLVETLGRVRQNPYEVLLIDCTPAGIDGVALCRRIRAQVSGRQPHLVVMLAAHEIAHAHAGLAAGADDWLIKSDDAGPVLARLAVAQRMLQQKTDLWRLQGGLATEPVRARLRTPVAQPPCPAATPSARQVSPVPDLSHLARLADKLAMPIAYVDETLRLAFFNPAYVNDPFGELRAPAYVGASLQDVIGVAAFENLAAEIGCVLSGIPVHFTRERGEGGRQQTLHVSYFPDCDPQGRVLGFFSITLDVSAERTMAATVEWQNRLLHGLASSMQLPSMLLGADGKILFHNDALTALTVSRSEDLRGIAVEKVMEQAFHAQHREPFAAALAGSAQDVAIVLRAPVGVQRYHWRYAPQRNAAGAISGVWCNVTEVVAALPCTLGMHAERRQQAG